MRLALSPQAVGVKHHFAFLDLGVEFIVKQVAAFVLKALLKALWEKLPKPKLPQFRHPKPKSIRIEATAILAAASFGAPTVTLLKRAGP